MDFIKIMKYKNTVISIFFLYRKYRNIFICQDRIWNNSEFICLDNLKFVSEMVQNIWEI